MACQKCKSVRILDFSGKCADLFTCSIGEKEREPDYVIKGANIGGGDYLAGKLCLDCGQMQGKFPVPVMDMEIEEDEDDDDDEDYE